MCRPAVAPSDAAPSAQREPDPHGLAVAEPRRLAFIDALRGLAASWVMVFHFYNELTRGGQVQRVPSPLHELLRHGMLGVNVFFVLSGFVIAMSVGSERVTPGFVGRFALRRSIRLDPLYWLVIFLMYGVLLVSRGPLGAATGDAEWKIILLNMLYLDELVGVPVIVHVGWTLCLEFQFYLVYVIVLGVAQRVARVLGRVLVFVPLLFWSLAIMADLLPLPTPGLFIGAWCMFFLGAAVAWVVAGASRAWLLVFVPVAAVLALHFDLGLGVSAATAAMLYLAGERGRRDWLAWRPLQYLGRISYSLYLVHPLVGHRITRWGVRRFGNPPPPLESVLLYLAAVVASLVAAHLLHVLVERPTLRLAKRIRMRRREISPG
jgi:peptidoglycan/LPS O-acetylase OafA/YrhL